MSHISDLVIDGLHGGSLSAGEAAAARAHLEACAACATREAELRMARRAFEASFSPDQLAAQTLSRPSGGSPWAWVGALAAVAALVLVAVNLRAPAPETRVKGAAEAVELFVLRGGEPVSATAVAPGSTLRLRFDPGGRAFARFLWADADGGLGALSPLSAAPAMGLGDGRGPRWLRYEIELDAEARDEAAVAVFCDRDFSHAEAIAARADCDVVRVAVRKKR